MMLKRAKEWSHVPHCEKSRDNDNSSMANGESQTARRVLTGKYFNLHFISFNFKMKSWSNKSTKKRTKPKEKTRMI